MTSVFHGNHIKLTIQSGLARHVSQPLDELMNNGHTRESRHHIAVLEEEDVETFVGFCEFAYTGDYTVPRRRRGAELKAPHGVAFADSPMVTTIPPPAPSPPQTPGLGEDLAEALKSDGSADFAGQDEGSEAFPESGKKGKKAKNRKKQKGKPFEEGAASALTPPSTPPPVNEGEEEKEEAVDGEKESEQQSEPEAAQTTSDTHWFDMESSKKPETEASKPEPLRLQPQNSFLLSPRSSVNLWDEFTSLQYTQQQYKSGLGLPSPILRSVSTYAGEASGHDPYVLFHAKLYVFASRYLIPTLAHTCLTKLHRDLVSYPLTTAGLDNARPTNVPMILELLHFAYTNTKRDDPVFALPNAPPARENQLRKLVTHFAACKVRELAGYQPALRSPASYGLPDTVLDGKDASGLLGLTIPAHLGFRDLLDAIGELASDLVYRMM
ncbi:hypothetical protein PRK78_003926 [Emydomyces testavorans]|uniref:BTB domain-containing protein n=1 Tax=Emydomyces testavorans TaxID=2070801 RepID=A0AAF0DHP5_9EURO|nr:hypothetical protein PRK78_003926 [Emydomyces testavorans]